MCSTRNSDKSHTFSSISFPPHSYRRQLYHFLSSTNCSPTYRKREYGFMCRISISCKLKKAILWWYNTHIQLTWFSGWYCSFCCSIANKLLLLSECNRDDEIERNTPDSSWRDCTVRRRNWNNISKQYKGYVYFSCSFCSFSSSCILQTPSDHWSVFPPHSRAHVFRYSWNNWRSLFLSNGRNPVTTYISSMRNIAPR